MHSICCQLAAIMFHFLIQQNYIECINAHCIAKSFSLISAHSQRDFHCISFKCDVALTALIRDRKSRKYIRYLLYFKLEIVSTSKVVFFFDKLTGLKFKTYKKKRGISIIKYRV